MNANYKNYLIASKKSEHTINAYIDHIERMLNYVSKADEDIKFIDLVGYQATLADKSANTVCQHIAAIKSYFNFLRKFGVIDNDPSLDLERPKVNPKPKAYMTAEDVSAMIEAARKIRDKAIIATYASTGLRVSELCGLKLDDYYKAVNDGTYEIRICGKGNKERIVYLNEQVQNYINDYLKTRNDDCEYLFASFQHSAMCRGHLGEMLKETARRAGLPYWENMSNHNMRAAFATIASDKGVPVATISKAMGHSSLAVTTVYIKNSQKNINNAMASMVF